MVTDTPLHKSNLAEFRESDRITTIDLPDDEWLPGIARSIEAVMKSERTANVRRPCIEFLSSAAQFYQIPDCSVQLLAARPLRVREQWTTELFGEHAPDTMSSGCGCGRQCERTSPISGHS